MVIVILARFLIHLILNASQLDSLNESHICIVIIDKFHREWNSLHNMISWFYAMFFNFLIL